MGHPTIYPTGTTVYLPEKAWSGYTISQAGFSTGGKERGADVIFRYGNRGMMCMLGSGCGGSYENLHFFSRGK